MEELGQNLRIEEEYRINSVDEQVNSSSKVHMVEEGKEAKQKNVLLWKGRCKGSRKGGVKRHYKVLRDNIHGITKSAIRCLARRGGVRRINGLIYEETQSVEDLLGECDLQQPLHTPSTQEGRW
ncbi:hypothetical protein LWI29_002121 [Acer saccharum]|uniref:Histone H4 n=1 Tax=Acer saccharum TaxID=4024 RepID=A0AA39SB94_ACESA|nr:hypothetical protein LWI29_002121 [Acer saccharum]